jgi:hypothetical protein
LVNALRSFFEAVKLIDIYQWERKMKKEVVIIASENESVVEELKDCLRGAGYSSIVCETTEELVEELDIMQLCSVYVFLVVIEPAILENVSDDLISRLSECALYVPFTILDGCDLTADLAERFVQICVHRGQFKQESNQLTDVLKGAGVAATCG